MCRTFGAHNSGLLLTPASRPALPKCRAFSAGNHAKPVVGKPGNDEARSAATRVAPRVSAGVDE